MPSKAGENSLQTMYKSRRDREGQSSIASRRKSVRMERKQRKDEKMNQRRGLTGMSTLSESINTDDQDLKDEDQIQLQSIQSNSNSKITGSGPRRAAVLNSRALSLKERLQKWREEKQKLLEQKKKQPPAFVVKTVEHKSDFHLYRGPSKNSKKQSKSEINFNFVESHKDKPVQLTGNHIELSHEGRKNPASTSSTRQTSKKLSQADIKKVPTKAQTTKIARQALKTEEPIGKPVGVKKVLTRGAKSSLDLHSSTRQSKPSSRLVKGDLHLRMTAAAAAKKQENSEKPKEFLRAKPHHFPTGRATRSQTKQANSERDNEVSCSASSTLKKSTSALIISAQPHNVFSEQRQALDHIFTVTDSDINYKMEESPRKKPRKSITRGIPHNNGPEKSIINGNTSNDSDDQSDKVDSVCARKTRRSIFKSKEEADVDANTKNTPSAKKERSLTSDVVSQRSHTKSSPNGKSSQCTALYLEINTNSPKTGTPDKRLRSKVLSETASSAEEQTESEAEPPRKESLVTKDSGQHLKAKEYMVSTSEDEPAVLDDQGTAISVRKSRRSKVNNCSRTPKHPVAKSIFAGISSEEEQDIGVLEVKSTPSKRTRRSVLKISTYQEDQIQERENILPQKPADQSVIKKEVSGEEEITNLAVICTPGKSPRRTVLKLPLKEDDQSDSSDSSIQARITPRRKSLARLATTSDDGAVSNPSSCQKKYTPRTKPRRSVVSVMSECSLKEKNCATVLTDENSKLDSNNIEKEIRVTPLRMSRRLVAAPAVGEKLDLSNTNSDSDHCNLNSMKTTRSTRSECSVSIPLERDTVFTNDKSDQTNAHLISMTAIPMEVENCIGNADKHVDENIDYQKQSESEDGHEADTHVSPTADSVFKESKQYNRRKSVGSKMRRVTCSGIGNSGSKRKSGKKTPKSARCQSRMRSRGSTTPTIFSPLTRRRKSTSTVVSVSEEGTSNLRGENVFDQATTPNSSFAENQFPISEPEVRRKSVRRSMRNDVIGREGMFHSTVYLLGKPVSTEAETGPLQELTVEKVEGETSYIEVPLDESGSSVKNISPLKSPTDRLEVSCESQRGTTIKSITSSNSSVETEPFTPRKSCNVTRASQESMPSVEATPDLPPRVAVRGFKTPFQAPRSAVRTKSSSTRLRRKTEHSTPSRSPEEMIKILERSPMIEMTRRRSRHVSSPASIVPSQLDLVEKQPVTSNEDLGSADASAMDTSLRKKCSEEEPAFGSTTDPHVLERVKHFRGILTAETERLYQLCKTWDEIGVYTFGISEDILGQIRTTVGKAQLLIAQRFKQFSGLVDNCEFNLGEQKTRPEDLQGFWEMIYFQVEDVDGLFKQLKALQDNNWEKPKSPPKLILKKKPIARKAAKPKGVSNFHAFRQEIMKRKAQKSAASVQLNNAVLTDSSTSVEGDQKEAEQARQNLEFDGVFFKVTSPARTSKGKRATLGSHTNSPEAIVSDQDDVKHTDVSPEVFSQASKPYSTPPVAANKENEVNSQGDSTPVLAAKDIPMSQAKLGISGKRLSYVPVVPSPLLRDTTGITAHKKL